MTKYILAIESSCDDTSASVISDANILSNVVSSQLDHQDLGGVVPELASRKHLLKIQQVVQKAISDAQISKSDLDAVAITKGPGLLGSLIVGLSFAKAFALGLDIPLIEVNHMEAHVLAHFIDEPRPKFPFLCLTVSGGHTQIVLVASPSEMTVIGKTRDDAAGEAFDKSGKLLGLPYPSGPVIDKLAQEGDAKFSFSKPKIDGLDFSFSGLKTGILYFLKKEMKANPEFINQEKANICASIQKTIVEILIEKLVKASEQTGITEIGIAGGVSANSGLRAALETERDTRHWNIYIPKIQYCTDNAAMIAMSAHFKYEKSEFATQDMGPEPRLKIASA